MAFDRLKMIADLESPANEGLRLVPYDDATGRPVDRGSTIKGNITNGIGWAMTRRPLTPDQSRTICGWHVDDIVQQMTAEFPWFAGLDDVRSRAFVNIAFANGFDGFLGFHQMIEAAAEGHWIDAAAEALRSQWAREEPGRAAMVARMIRTGVQQ